MTKSLNDQLMDAVSGIDVAGVSRLLQDGADPNYFHPLPGSLPDDIEQPTTPLKLLVFRISDSFVDDDGHKACAEIARLLLHHGADPMPAMAIARARYGPYDDATTGPFADVLHVVARAAAAQGWIADELKE